MKKLKKRFLLPFLLALIILPLLFALVMQCCTAQQGPTAPSRQALFGMPTAAKADPRQREDYLIERPQYVLSYNAKLNTPNWVSWSLRAGDIGKSTRGHFEADPLLPRGFERITSASYDGGGFDRGHMCPAQDRSSEQKDMDGTFIMTNVVPQAPHNNQRAWERLEAYCRDLAKSGNVLHIVCGPNGTGGEGKNGRRDEIGRSGAYINVPARVWKVILVLPGDQAVPDKNTRTIAVIMPNDQSVDFDWPKYRVAVRDVEKLTGYTFYGNLPAEVGAEIKGRVDDMKVHVPKSKFGGE